MSREIWPNFFIVGAPKAGTTSLYNYLTRTPGVYMSPMKEPRYFTTINPVEVTAMPPVRDRAEYLRLFQGAKDEMAIGEASVTYLRDPETPTRIREAVPDARIIMLLRDPVERAFSDYLMHVREGWQTLPFQEALRTDLYLEKGFYAQQVKRYLDTFGPERVKIIIFEEFIQDTNGSVSDVLKFLGVNGQPPLSAKEAYNAFAMPRLRWAYRILGSRWTRKAARALIPAPLRVLVKERILLKQVSKPAMPQEARKFLEDLYRDDVRKLEEFLGRRLPWPRGRFQ